jgi:pyridoxal phosphate enzyme (YggS family)
MHFPELAGRLAVIRGRIEEAVKRGGHGQSVEIVAVTKTHGPAAVEEAWAAGLTDVGENRVQEALDKMERVTVPVRWHLIGHLQRNKAKFAPRFVLVHSVDSLRLAGALNEIGVASGSALPVLIQVNVSGEESKGGFDYRAIESEATRLRSFAGLDVRGVMTMAPLDAAEAVLRSTFAGARQAAEWLRRAGHPATMLSMGMSGDFEIAVEEGATVVRLGTILFGARAPWQTNPST